MAIELQTLPAVSNRYLGQIATRCIVPNSFSATNKQQMSRSGHFARDHIVGVQLVLPNAYVTSAGVETLTGGSASFTASVEYPAGVFTQATFGGLVTGVTSASVIVSDIIKVTIPRGKKFWTKEWRADLSGIVFMSCPWFKSNSLQGDALNFSTTTVPDTTMTATATNGDANNLYTPIAIIGYTKYGSVLIIGDSIAAGQNDTADASGDVGNIARWLGGTVGYSNCGVPGDRATWFAANGVLRRSMGQYVSDIVLQHTINDLSNGRTTPQLQADLVTIGTSLRAAYPNKRLWIATSLPQTDAGNTTPVSGTNANRIIMNNWKRAIPSPFDGCIELADGVENSRDGGLFASATYTADGTHMTQAGYLQEAISAFVDPAMFAF